MFTPSTASRHHRNLDVDVVAKQAQLLSLSPHLPRRGDGQRQEEAVAGQLTRQLPDVNVGAGRVEDQAAAVIDLCDGREHCWIRTADEGSTLI